MPDTTDTLELEMDNPSAPRPAPADRDPELTAVLHKLAIATSRADMEAAIEPCRPWPEGPRKAKVRAALRVAQDRQALAREIAAPRVAPAPAPVKPEPTALEILHPLWGGMFASVARGLTERPHRGAMYGTPPTATPREPVVLGRVRTAQAPTIPALPDIATLAPTRDDVRNAINAREIVVGAREGGSGVLSGWVGQGELTVAQSQDACERAGLPREWGLKPRSPRAHASAALSTLTATGRILRAERGRRNLGSQPGIGTWSGAPRNYVARWTVGNALHGQVGDAFGRVVLAAALTAGGNLDLEGDDDLVTQVRAEYHRLSANEVYQAGDVTDWLRGLLIGRFNAVRLGANWYVPAREAQGAERLCAALAEVWGTAWILPALPVSTTDQLRAGLVRGLATDAETVLLELAQQRESARRDRPGADIGPKAAATLLGKLRTVYERSRGFRDLLGDEHTAALRTRLQTAIDEVASHCDDTAQRFAMLDLV